MCARQLIQTDFHAVNFSIEGLKLRSMSRFLSKVVVNGPIKIPRDILTVLNIVKNALKGLYGHSDHSEGQLTSNHPSHKYHTYLQFGAKGLNLKLLLADLVNTRAIHVLTVWET